MCGIIGAVAERGVAPVLLAALQRMEYRGYDSAGLAVFNKEISRLRCSGKVANLEKKWQENSVNGHIGLAHTRWATHGEPSEQNAHPHVVRESIALVHNGIVDNFSELKSDLMSAGYTFDSETDSEVLAALFHSEYEQEKNLVKAMLAVLNKIRGANSLVCFNIDEPTRLVGGRRGSPLVLGLGIEENFIASDHLALMKVAEKLVYLHDGDVALLEQKTVTIFDENNQTVTRDEKDCSKDLLSADKGEYRHYMLKEIHEQPDSLQALLSGRLGEHQIAPEVFGLQARLVFQKVKRVQIVACGTSYHTGLTAMYWFESILGLPCRVETASEFRYRDTAVEEDTLLVAISQSGETADTLAAVRKNRSAYLATLALCNVPESALVRESDLALLLNAGPEVGVASTKAFTSQLTAVLMLMVCLGQEKAIICDKYVEALHELPGLVKSALEMEADIEALASDVAKRHNALFIARGVMFPIALEGALKLKEISYIHAEAYPAGELKHGTLALVDETMPVIALAPKDALSDKMLSNIQTVIARQGELITFSDEMVPNVFANFSMPSIPEILHPIVYTIPLQLLAYHVALQKGTDVDQPRNLAKSVTVE